MNKFLGLAFATLLVSACGGSNDSSPSSVVENNTNEDSTPEVTNPETPHTETLTNTPSNLTTNNASNGETLRLITPVSITDPAQFNQQLEENSYYGRFAYCANQSYIGCERIRVGRLSFEIDEELGALALEDLEVDNIGDIVFDDDDVPVYSSVSSSGEIALAEASLTPIATNNDAITYKLNLIPASSIETRIPAVSTMQLTFSPDGMHVAGADDDYILVAQQYDDDSLPQSWSNSSVTKSMVAGDWMSYAVNENLIVTDRTAVRLSTNEIVAGAASFRVNDGSDNYHGYYKNLGSGYVLGYTEDNQPLNSTASNYTGISGVMLLAPNGNFGIGYDIGSDESFLLFR